MTTRSQSKIIKGCMQDIIVWMLRQAFSTTFEPYPPTLMSDCPYCIATLRIAKFVGISGEQVDAIWKYERGKEVN